jgi:hypothetical protein
VIAQTAGNPNVTAGLGIGTNGIVFGLGALGASTPVGTGIPDTYTSSIDFGIDVTGFTSSQHLLVGLFNPVFDGPSFDSLSFRILEGENVLDQQTFTSQSAAQAYFTDHVFDFGPIPNFGTSSIDVAFDLTFAASSPGSAFRTEAAVGTVVPEPSGVVLLSTGLASLALIWRWRKRKQSPPCPECS